MGCHFLLQGIFPTRGLSLGLPHCRQTLYHPSHQGSRKTKGYFEQMAFTWLYFRGKLLLYVPSPLTPPMLPSGLPRWLCCKEFSCQWRRNARHKFDPYARKIPWRRKWQPTPVLLPGNAHGERSLLGYSPGHHKESDITEHTHTHMHDASL